jgi:thiamine-phosphate pyrophosphorylase
VITGVGLPTLGKLEALYLEARYCAYLYLDCASESRHQHRSMSAAFGLCASLSPAPSASRTALCELRSPLRYALERRRAGRFRHYMPCACDHPITSFPGRSIASISQRRASFDPTVYVITHEPSDEGSSLLRIVEDALAGGARVIQYRNKSRSPVREEEATAILKLTRRAGALLIVNDDPELAAQINADGVHVGQGDADLETARVLVGAGRLVGVSVGNVAEADRAIADGADYIGVGPVFATNTKADARPPLGLGRLMEIVDAVAGRVPVVAIGGINEGNCGGCACVGADGVAVISIVMSANDPRSVTRMLRERFADGRPPPSVPESD